ISFASAPRMSVLGMFTSCLDPLNARITLLLSFVSAHYLRRDRATAGDHASAFGRCDQQADSRRDPRCRQGFGLPAARPDQRGGAEPPARRLQPGWAVPTKAPGDVALGRAPAVRVLGACRVDRAHRTLSDLPLDHAEGGTADGRGAKRWSKIMGSPRAVSAPVDAEDQAGGTGDRSLGGGNLAASTWGRIAQRHPRALHSMEIREPTGGSGVAGKAGTNPAGRHPRHRRVLAGNLVRACG